MMITFPVSAQIRENVQYPHVSILGTHRGNKLNSTAPKRMSPKSIPRSSLFLALCFMDKIYLIQSVKFQTINDSLLCDQPVFQYQSIQCAVFKRIYSLLGCSDKRIAVKIE